MEERHEIIEFPANSPLKIFLHRLGNVSPHWHNSLEILFILSGTLYATVDNRSYTLKEEDLILINSNSIHSLHSEGCELTAYQLNLHAIQGIPNRPGISFHCVSADTPAETAPYFDKLKQLLARLLKINEEKSNSLLTLSVLSEPLSLLETHFQSKTPPHSANDKNLQRLSSITDYIHRHYKEALTLTQLANHEHFSVSYLSKFFKENMGVNFLDYYNNIRLEYAVNELMSTDNSIATIASNNGFSDVRTFVSLFKKQYHMLPSEYRKKNPAIFSPTGSLPEINYLALTNSDALQKLAKYLKQDHVSGESQNEGSMIIDLPENTISVTHSIRRMRHTFRRLCCAGSTRDLFSAQMRSILTEIQRETPFSYIRFHGLLSNDTMIYDENTSGAPVFSFTRIDELFDFLLSIHLKPVLQLSFTPDALASDPKKTSFYIHYNTSQPKDYRKWTLLVEQLLVHLIQRYSAEEVNTWPVILWNEPDTSPSMFGFRNFEDFYELYRCTWETVRSVSRNIPIGSPPLMLFHKDIFGFSQNFFCYCRENHCMPDFINVNFYSDVLDFNKLCENYSVGISQSKLPTSADTFAAFLNKLPQSSAVYRTEGIPVAVSEWNVTVNHRNLINDTCYKACYLAKNILENYDKAEAFGYWSLTDYISELQPSDQLFHGGLGLFTANGIPKPPYHVVRFLFALGDEMTGSGNGWFATKNSKTQQQQIIFYNYCHYSQLFSTGENFDLSYTNRYTIFPNTHNIRFHIKLTDIHASSCLVRETFVNREHGSAYDNWVETGAFQEMLPADIAWLKQVSQPGCYIHREAIANQALELHVTLKPFEVRLITITP